MVSPGRGSGRGRALGGARIASIIQRSVSSSGVTGSSPMRSRSFAREPFRIFTSLPRTKRGSTVTSIT